MLCHPTTHPSIRSPDAKTDHVRPSHNSLPAMKHRTTRTTRVRKMPREMLMRIPSRSHAEAAVAHCKRHGVLTRQMAKYGLPDCLRVSIGADWEMRMAADAFAAFARQHGLDAGDPNGVERAG